MLTWTIERLTVVPGQDIVFTSFWRLNGVDGNYTGSVYGSQDIVYNPTDPFTPYGQLTESQVLDWTKAALGEAQVAELEANVLAQIDAQKNPPVIELPLPWQMQ